MKNFLANLKWFAAGFLLVALVVGALSVLPAIGQGSVTNERESTSSAEVSSPSDDPSNLTTDADITTASESRTENGQELGVPSEGVGTTNVTDVSDGQTEVGVEEGIELESNVLVFSPSEFSNDGNTPNNFFLSFWDGQLQGSIQTPCFAVPVNAPNGHSIYQFWATVYDNTSGNVWMNLYRANNYTGVVDVMAILSSGDSVNLQQLSDASIDFPLVTYPDYSYFIGTCIQGADIYIKSARVWFTP
jgi:hypothetical protein